MPVTLGQSFRGSPEFTIGEIRLTEFETKADDIGVRPARLLDR